MKRTSRGITLLFIVTTIAAMALFVGACSSSKSDGTKQRITNTQESAPVKVERGSELADHVSPTVEPTAVVVANVTRTLERTAGTARILEPYPYTTPVPPPTPTILDGVYTREVKFAGTPTPCRRCAPYRAEGGTWTLVLDAGAFRVSHTDTDFQGIGSFTVLEDQVVLFNDPNCHLYVGSYTWELDGRLLILKVAEDECAFGLRAKNLAAGAWGKQFDEEGHQLDQCQPPSMEAAISSHWPAPGGCQ